MAVRSLGIPWATGGTSLPVSVGIDNLVGSQQDSVPRSDHVHAARIQRFFGVTDSNGQVAVTYARPFATKPVPIATFEELSNNQPVVLKTLNHVQDGGGLYIGLVIQAYRAQTLPAVLTLITQLIGFNIFGGVVGAGIPIAIFVGEATQ